MSDALARIREEIETALDDGDYPRALRLARDGLRREADAESWYLLGVALLSNGEADEGENALEAAVGLDPAHADAHVALAEEAVGRLEYAQAAERLAAAVRAEPLHAGALRLRGCLRETRGDWDGAERDFAAAALLDPEGCPAPVPLDDATIEVVTEDVLRSLHPSLRAYLANVPILVEELPSDDLLLELSDAHPFELLGAFAGRSLADTDSLASATAWSALPPTITVFRRNLQRFAHDPEELTAELRITLLHEIGHYLGLDEQDLVDRGLD